MDPEDRTATLYRSCQKLAPINPNYANLPIEEGFDWSLLSDAPFCRLYLVAFRSVRRETADTALLKEYDDRAYNEAIQAGGLLRYFKGQANERRECLSFCLWESVEQARAAAGSSSHQVAAGIWSDMYEAYDLERYYLSQGDDGDLVFDPLVTDRVGGSG